MVLQNLALCDVCRDDLPRLLGGCQCCGLPLSGVDIANTLCCGDCLRRPPSYFLCRAPFVYQGPIRELLSRFKFRGGLAEGAALGHLLARSYREFYAGTSPPGLLLPVPLHARRLRERGFNQAGLLAASVARHCGTPLGLDQVRRVRHTVPQHRLSAAARRSNLRAAFSVNRDFPAGTLDHVAIVDDVVTTGATVNALARLLQSRGARRVDVWSVARATGTGEPV